MKNLTLTDRTPENENAIMNQITELIISTGWTVIAEQFVNEPEMRERIALFIGSKVANKLGMEKGARATDLMMLLA